MSPTVSLAVMAHPRRARFVDELLSRLDRPATVVWDRKGDRWDTGRRAWLAVDTSASHGLVVQDDAIPCRDLVAGVETALTALPDPDRSPLCLYVGRVRPYKEAITQLVAASSDDTSWLTMSQLHWGPGIVMPVGLISDMVAWCDHQGHVANYDRRISRWCQARGLTVYYPWPSLVDHRGVRENPSLVPGRSGDRRAHRFIGAEASALDRDWTGGVVSIPSLSRSSDAYVPRYRPPPAEPPRPRRPKLGVPVKFISPKYPQLQVYGARVRFRDGKAETRDPDAIAKLLKLRHMGVEAVEPERTEPSEVEGASTDTEPTPPEATAADDQPPTGVEQTEVPPPDLDRVPDGGAKEVLTWVANDPARARRALEAEQARDKPRTTLMATLTKIAEA